MIIKETKIIELSNMKAWYIRHFLTVIPIELIFIQYCLLEFNHAEKIGAIWYEHESMPIKYIYVGHGLLWIKTD